MLQQVYPFALPPLPYAYDALEPYIDAETMHYHHDKHFQTYIDNLNKALEPYPALQGLTLEQLLGGRVFPPRGVRSAILHNAGGVYNHALYFAGLSPAGSGPHEPQGRLLMRITESFGDLEAFQKAFVAQALAVFGSGWAALVPGRRNSLRIVSLRNQDTTVPAGMKPLILADVWEHAYYLKYKNARAGYLDALWHVMDYPPLEGGW